MNHEINSAPKANAQPVVETWRSQWKQLLGIVLAVVAVRTAFVSPCHVPSGSMLPTMEVGDILLMSKWAYGWNRYSLPYGHKIPYFQGRFSAKDPQRGDIVVFAPPVNRSEELFVKRVVGVAGDSIQMRQGILHINDSPIAMQPVSSGNTAYDGKKEFQAKRFKVAIPTDKGWAHYHVYKQQPFGHGQGDNTALFTVPEGHVFVMGDNWDGSGDSRFMDHLGFVPLDHVVGRPWFTYLSINTKNISWKKPWTWLTVPFNIRWKRCGYRPIQPDITDKPAVSHEGVIEEVTTDPSQAPVQTSEAVPTPDHQAPLSANDHTQEVPSDQPLEPAA